jgi:hypothetical protein
MRKDFACCVLLAAAFCTPVSAQPQVSGQLGQCMGIFGAVERLACYDRVARSVNPMGPSQQPAAVARPPQYAPAPAAQYTAPAAPVSQYAAAPVPASRYPYAPAAAAPVVAAAAPSSQTRATQFGSEYLAPAPGAARPVNAIESQIQSFRFTPQHRFVLQLENGQEWKQIEGDTGQPILTSLKTRSVTITRGALGSYNLVFSDQSGAYKVERTL